MEPLFVVAHPSELVGIPGEIVGVGLVDSALGAARAIARFRAGRPPAVVLLGSCGAYEGSGLAIGSLVAARTCTLACPGAAEGRAGWPGPVHRHVHSDDAWTDATGLRAVTVATTLSVTTDDALARALARDAVAQVENLEAFAVARACAEANVPFTAILGVTNTVGARGRQEWRAHAAEVAARVCAAARALRSPTTPRSPA